MLAQFHPNDRGNNPWDEKRAHAHACVIPIINDITISLHAALLMALKFKRSRREILK